MWEDGFTYIDSCDYSQVVIDKMREVYRDIPPLQFHVQDVRQMTFPSASFDVVLDKGTLDAILCGAESHRHATSMLSECQRVLKDSGVLLIITYGQPASRLSYLEQSRYQWDVSYEVLEGPAICTSALRSNNSAYSRRVRNDGRHSSEETGMRYWSGVPSRWRLKPCRAVHTTPLLDDLISSVDWCIEQDGEEAWHVNAVPRCLTTLFPPLLVYTHNPPPPCFLKY